MLRRVMDMFQQKSFFLSFWHLSFKQEKKCLKRNVKESKKRNFYIFSTTKKKKKLENSFDNKSYVIWVGSKMNQRIKNLNCKNFFKNNKITVVAKKKQCFITWPFEMDKFFSFFHFIFY